MNETTTEARPLLEELRYHTPGILEARPHFQNPHMVCVWMKTTVVTDRLFKKMYERDYIPSRIEVRPIPNFPNKSAGLRGSQCLYIEVLPLEVSYHV